MYNLMIITHGPLALALKETLKMFTGNVEDVYAVGLTETGVEEFREKVNKALEECYEEGNELLVLVDLFGGTPFNISMLDIKNKYKNVEIIAGANLPLVIEASILRDSNLSDVIETLKESAKGAVLSPERTDSSEDDE